jgi:hypothetical protein
VAKYYENCEYMSVTESKGSAAKNRERHTYERDKSDLISTAVLLKIKKNVKSTVKQQKQQ